MALSTSWPVQGLDTRAPVIITPGLRSYTTPYSECAFSFRKQWGAGGLDQTSNVPANNLERAGWAGLGSFVHWTEVTSGMSRRWWPAVLVGQRSGADLTVRTVQCKSVRSVRAKSICQ